MRVLANKRTGISLVALIVTIIVLIILTGAVIVTFMEGGIVDRAKYAVRKSDLATLQESYMIEYNKKKIDVDTGTTEGIDKIEILEKAVKSVKLEKDFEFAKYGTVNSVTYVGDNEDIAQWVGELLLESTDGYILANGYLTNLSNKGTTVAQIKEQLGNDIIVKKYSGEILEDEINVGTGATIEKDGEVIATTVLFGECGGDDAFNSNDAALILLFLNGGSQKQVLLAGDVNNDGYISGEDADYVLASFTGGPKINQKRIIYKLPTKYSRLVYEEEDGEIYSYEEYYIYTWYGKTDWVELINEKGVYIAESKTFGINLTIPEGTTYLEIENELKETISSGVEIIDIEDKSTTASVNEYFNISIPEIIDENTRSKVTSLKFKIKAIN